MGFKVTSTGNFKNTETYLFNHRKSAFSEDELIKIAEYGLSRFISNSPKKSGKTASSWSYEIVRSNGSIKIEFHNTNINQGVPIAIILQYGHGTGTGGWVQGRDYINPAIQPIFDKIADSAWREVTKL